MSDLSARIQQALSQSELRDARRHGTQGIRERVPKSLEPYPDIAHDTRRAKEDALAHLPELLRETQSQLLAHGFHVFAAPDAEAARHYVLSHIPVKSLVIKSKSNLAKEIHLSDALIAAGHQVIETDLGDHINQLLGRRSGHVLMPALGVDIPTIRAAFRDRYSMPDLGDDPSELVRAARQHLRPILASAEVSISGANAITATGQVVLMENEGNIRAVTSLPRIHFVVAGVNKLVRTLEDGLTVVQAASLYGIGQDLGNYCTVLSGPGRDVGPEVHVVLVDDGRVNAIADEPEPFYCINCGSCLNVCPVYGELGESYGGERLGGIGIMQTFLLEGEKTATRDGLDLCLGCQRCVPMCPVHIDTPTITNRLKASRRVRPESHLRRELLALVLNRGRLRFSRHILRAAAAMGTPTRWHRRNASAKDFIPVPDPAPSPPLGAEYPARGETRGAVWLFPGCVMDAWYGQVHLDTVNLLTEQGFAVRIPKEAACCGALHEHAGEPGPVPTLMELHARSFPGTDPIIVNAAGCGAFLKQHENVLMPRIRDLSEFLAEAGFRAPTRPVGRRIVYHNPCHLAFAQGIAETPRKLLENAGYALLDASEREACCGSAGTYNLEFPELAWRLAQEKAEDLTHAEPEWVVTANPGCLMQIRAGLDAVHSSTPAVHLASALWAAFKEGAR